MDLLAHMLSTPKLLVEGVAGSGKTLLAVQRALDSASQGLKTLFLCYNKTLAQELRHHLRGSSVDVHHFHELCHQLCQQAGIEFKVQQQATAQFWDEDIPEKAMQALEKLPQRRWQSLVIDEGQDFLPVDRSPLPLARRTQRPHRHILRPSPKSLRHQRPRAPTRQTLPVNAHATAATANPYSDSATNWAKSPAESPA